MAKLAIVGTHGVGKTGLVYSLASAFTQHSIPVDPILEVARELTRLEPEKVRINESTTLESQVRILEYQFHREVQAELEAKNTKKIIICDRSFDNYLYMERKFGPQPKYENLILEHLKNHPYTLIIKVPIIEQEIQVDGFRDTNSEFQKDIDSRIDSFLKKHNISYLILPDPVMPNREEWTYIVLKKLGYRIRFNGLNTGRN